MTPDPPKAPCAAKTKFTSGAFTTMSATSKTIENSYWKPWIAPFTIGSIVANTRYTLQKSAVWILPPVFSAQPAFFTDRLAEVPVKSVDQQYWSSFGYWSRYAFTFNRISLQNNLNRLLHHNFAWRTCNQCPEDLAHISHASLPWHSWQC